MITKEEIKDTYASIIERLDNLYNMLETLWGELHMENPSLANKIEQMQFSDYAGIMPLRSQITALKDQCIEVVEDNEGMKNYDEYKGYKDIEWKLSRIAEIIEM